MGAFSDSRQSGPPDDGNVGLARHTCLYREEPTAASPIHTDSLLLEQCSRVLHSLRQQG